MKKLFKIKTLLSLLFVVFIPASLSSCSSTRESFGTYNGYEAIYEKDEFLEENFHCDTLLNYKFCYKKGYSLTLQKDGEKVYLKFAFADLVLTPYNLPELFESFDCKHPRDYSHKYEELYAECLPFRNFDKIDYCGYSTQTLTDLYIYPSSWFAYHRFTDEELFLDQINATADSDYDLYISQLIFNSNYWSSLNRMENVMCYYHVNLSQHTINDKTLIINLLNEAYYIYKLRFNISFPTFY